LFTEKDDRGVVVDVLAFDIKNAVVTVRGVGVKGHIGKDWQIGEFFLEGSEGAGDEAVGIESGPAILGAEGGFDTGKDGDAADAALGESGRVPEDSGNRMAGMAREARDRRGCAGAVFHKERSDQVGRGNRGFREEAANARGAAKAATSDGDGKSGFQRVKKILKIGGRWKAGGGNVRERECEGERAE
jgi:hypothetical protein